MTLVLLPDLLAFGIFAIFGCPAFLVTLEDPTECMASGYFIAALTFVDFVGFVILISALVPLE